MRAPPLIYHAADRFRIGTMAHAVQHHFSHSHLAAERFATCLVINGLGKAVLLAARIAREREVAEIEGLKIIERPPADLRNGMALRRVNSEGSRLEQGRTLFPLALQHAVEIAFGDGSPERRVVAGLHLGADQRQGRQNAERCSNAGETRKTGQR